MHTHTHTHPETHHIYALKNVYLHIMQIICLNIVKYAVPSQQSSQAPIQQDRGEDQPVVERTSTPPNAYLSILARVVQLCDVPEGSSHF